MAQLKIAVLGASGIGKFHVREFVNAGTDIAAILGGGKETALETAESLRKEFGVHPNAYWGLDELLGSERLDGVSICTPPRMHCAEVKKCLEKELHVLCEKPLVLNSYAENRSLAEELVKLSEKKGRILTMNTQWPSILGAIKDLVNLSELRNFSMEIQPGSTGIDMLIEGLSHPNSILVKLISGGCAEDIRVIEHSKKNVEVHFTYINKSLTCTAHYKFTHKADRPRKVSFSFNGTEFRREIGKHYQQRLVGEKTTLDIEDPFKVSIQKFVGAIEGKDSPLISTKEILENMAPQDQIIAEYMKITGSASEVF